MNDETEKTDIPFPSYEALGDTSAGPVATRRHWTQIFAGFLVTAVILAAAIPEAVENEVYEMPPGPVADQLFYSAEWWRQQTGTLETGRPAQVMRGAVEAAGFITWEDVICGLQERGWVEPSFKLPGPLSGLVADSAVCE